MRLAPVMLAVALTSTGCSVPGPGGADDTFGLDLPTPAGTKVRGAVVFIVDGLNAAIFQEMLEAGELPAVRKYFADRGLYAPRAAANVPSVTLANLTSIATGQFPGHHGVTGINWFDRNSLIWRDYATIAQKNTLDGDYIAATVFEQFPDQPTFSVFFQPHRGATKFVENWTSAGPPYFFGWYEFVDRLTLWRLNMVADVARKTRRWPAVTVVYLLAPNFRAYEHGIASRQYREAMKHTDRQIGRVLGDFEKAGLLDNLVIALTSDHGQTAIRKHFSVERLLRERGGLKVAPAHLWEQTPFETRLDYYGRYSCVLYGSGDRYTAICLRKPAGEKDGEGPQFEPWFCRPSAADLKAYPSGASRIEALFSSANVKAAVDLPNMLLENEAVDAVTYAVAPNRVRVARRGGEVEFRQDGGRGMPISYHVVAGQDPMGWEGKVPQDALSGKTLGERDWLRMTVGTRHPDLPAQILAYFRAHRAADIAVFAADGWNFNNWRRGGHGGLSPGDMHVPVLLAGPGVPKGRVEAVRTVDLLPTLLGLLGRPIPADLDGKPLVP
ncbi:MAG TPA: alkaline phosphatase family protein [Phycisphaerae bacterium]|nr:alkaline phosphatase family protein [Phycisphaerae bacterium]